MIILLMMAQCGFAQGASGTITNPAPADQVSQSTDAQAIIIPLENGGVDAGLLFQSVADELHWVAGSVAGFSRAFGVEAIGNQLSAAQVESLVQRFPNIFSYAKVAGTEQPGLSVETRELAKMLADNKSNLRRWLASIDGQSLAELNKVEATWAPNLTAPPRIVIVTPGLHSPIKSAEDMALVLHERTNLPMCVFKYPNDGPLLESAQWLQEELEKLHRAYPTSKLSLVSHSMGGLVARGAIELPSVDSGVPRAPFSARVGLDQLLQICPPNHGSGLSEYGPVLEGFEALYNLVQRGIRRSDTKSPRVLVSMIADGFNEASADLNPSSDYLKQLNACPRDPNVRYTILAGDAGPLKPGMSGLLGNVWERIATAVEQPEGIERRISDVLKCPELQNGLGDGVVSVESARLDGVEDFELLPMHHLSWIELDSETGLQLVDALAIRLGVSL